MLHLTRLGIDPWADEVPTEFSSSAWWLAKRDNPGATPTRGIAFKSLEIRGILCLNRCRFYDLLGVSPPHTLAILSDFSEKLLGVTTIRLTLRIKEFLVI